MSDQPNATRRVPGPVDVGFIAAFAIIGVVQVAALAHPSVGLEAAADVSRYVLVVVALLQIGWVIARARRDSADIDP